MKIAFYCASYDSEAGRRLPLGVGCLGAYLEARRLFERRQIVYARTHDEALAAECDLLCVSSTSQVIDDAYALARAVRHANPAVRCVLGGYHVTAVPLSLGEPFGVGVMGEGEQTLAGLVRLAATDRWNSDAWSGVAGLCYRDREEERGRVRVNDRRPLIEDLDTLPMPHRLPPSDMDEEVFMFTSRGCPYRCIYCASAVHWGRCRYHSPRRVVDEIERLHVRYGTRRIVLADDLFAAKKDRLRAIIDLLRERRLLGSVRFRGFVRANLMDAEMADLLAEMGFYFVRFGAESASQRILDKLKCGTVHVTQLQNTVDLCNERELKVGASFVFGTPGEGEEDLAATFDFLLANRGRCVLAGFYMLTPYPGTELWGWAKQRSIVDERMDWTRLALDFCKPEFDWNRAVYLNEDCIPLRRFRQLIQNFRDEYQTAASTARK